MFSFCPPKKSLCFYWEALIISLRGHKDAKGLMTSCVVPLVHLRQVAPKRDVYQISSIKHQKKVSYKCLFSVYFYQFAWPPATLSPSLTNTGKHLLFLAQDKYHHEWSPTSMSLVEPSLLCQTVSHDYCVVETWRLIIYWTEWTLSTPCMGLNYIPSTMFLLFLLHVHA